MVYLYNCIYVEIGSGIFISSPLQSVQLSWVISTHAFSYPYTITVLCMSWIHADAVGRQKGSSFSAAIRHPKFVRKKRAELQKFLFGWSAESYSRDNVKFCHHHHHASRKYLPTWTAAATRNTISREVRNMLLLPGFYSNSSSPSSSSSTVLRQKHRLALNWVSVCTIAWSKLTFEPFSFSCI